LLQLSVALRERLKDARLEEEHPTGAHQKEQKFTGAHQKQQDFTGDQAARIIQEFWRTSRVKRSFASNGYETYIQMLHPKSDSRHDNLGAIMFGRTVAGIIAGDNFPIKNPFMHRNALYHRDDNLRGQLCDTVLKKFYPKPNFSNFDYIPIILLECTPANEIIDTYLANDRYYVEFKKIKGEQIAFFRVDKSSPYYGTILKTIRATGLIASPWSIASAYARIRKIDSLKDEPANNDVLEAILPHLPSTITELKNGKKMGSLARLAVSKNGPTKLLAACLYRLISALPDSNIDAGQVQRIYLFLNLATTCYKQDYNAFSICLYAIMHEISLILSDSLERGNPLISFEQFQEETIKNAITHFGIVASQDNEGQKYRHIAAPAMAGTNAYLLAMKLAKKMDIGRPPSIKAVGANYYEFEKLHRSESVSDPSDIYVVSIGPVVNTGGGDNPRDRYQ